MQIAKQELHLELPELWRAAFERDRENPLRGNDPLPERQAARFLAAFILTGLVFVLLPGTLLGVWNRPMPVSHTTFHADGSFGEEQLKNQSRARRITHSYPLLGWLAVVFISAGLDMLRWVLC
jgi:hypothetical protein